MNKKKLGTVEESSRQQNLNELAKDDKLNKKNEGPSCDKHIPGKVGVCGIRRRQTSIQLIFRLRLKQVMVGSADISYLASGGDDGNPTPGATPLQENPPTSGIVRHESHMRKSGSYLAGIEPSSSWWETSRLTAQPPRPLPVYLCTPKEQHLHCTTPYTNHITLTPLQHRHKHRTHDGHLTTTTDSPPVSREDGGRGVASRRKDSPPPPLDDTPLCAGRESDVQGRGSSASSFPTEHEGVCLEHALHLHPMLDNQVVRTTSSANVSSTLENMRMERGEQTAATSDTFHTLRNSGRPRRESNRIRVGGKREMKTRVKMGVAGKRQRPCHTHTKMPAGEKKITTKTCERGENLTLKANCCFVTNFCFNMEEFDVRQFGRSYLGKETLRRHTVQDDERARIAPSLLGLGGRVPTGSIPLLMPISRPGVWWALPFSRAFIPPLLQSPITSLTSDIPRDGRSDRFVSRAGQPDPVRAIASSHTRSPWLKVETFIFTSVVDNGRVEVRTSQMSTQIFFLPVVQQRAFPTLGPNNMQPRIDNNPTVWIVRTILPDTVESSGYAKAPPHRGPAQDRRDRLPVERIDESCARRRRIRWQPCPRYWPVWSANKLFPDALRWQIYDPSTHYIFVTGTHDHSIPDERHSPNLAMEWRSLSTADIMVWGGIACYSRSASVVFRGALTAQQYVDEILHPQLLPFLAGIPGAIFQQDNAQPHTPRVAQDCIRERADAKPLPNSREAGLRDDTYGVTRAASVCEGSTSQDHTQLSSGDTMPPVTKSRVLLQLQLGCATPCNCTAHDNQLVTQNSFRLPPPTKANRVQSPAGPPEFRKWESCQTMPLVSGFSRGSPVFPASYFRRRSIFTSITLIGYQDLSVKSHPNLFTHSVLGCL
ncbi:hypothetical protein PR048_008655 [Dryococelus australis]|uniref:Uncharacterized protein n=1 Tax=Dryococelus australis TaxID=614101 RepID=A0ABQ9HYJ1_9NEOP|nr:hypothetical protein PR048_008655 [Dryococelus australis]